MPRRAYLMFRRNIANKEYWCLWTGGSFYAKEVL